MIAMFGDEWVILRHKTASAPEAIVGALGSLEGRKARLVTLNTRWLIGLPPVGGPRDTTVRTIAQEGASLRKRDEVALCRSLLSSVLCCVLSSVLSSVLCRALFSVVIFGVLVGLMLVVFVLCFQVLWFSV